MLGGDLRDVQLIDGRTKRALLLTACRAGDDDLIELDRALGHGELQVRRADVDGLRDGAIANHANADDDLRSGDSGDTEPPRRIGDGALSGLILYRDLNARDGAGAGLRDDGAGDDTILRPRDARKRKKGRHESDGAGTRDESARAEPSARANGTYDGHERVPLLGGMTW